MHLFPVFVSVSEGCQWVTPAHVLLSLLSHIAHCFSNPKQQQNKKRHLNQKSDTYYSNHRFSIILLQPFCTCRILKEDEFHFVSELFACFFFPRSSSGTLAAFTSSGWGDSIQILSFHKHDFFVACAKTNIQPVPNRLLNRDSLVRLDQINIRLMTI